MKTSKNSARLVLKAMLAANVFVMSQLAQADRFDDADRAAQEGRLGDMQAIYEEILESDPSNARALSGKAAAQAWQGDYADAQESYRRAIYFAPDDVEAKVGLGYAFAWNAQYADAHTWFNNALNSDPFHVGARKGIGYAYLWSGNYDLALSAFELAASVAPGDAEIPEAAGYASMSLGHARDAIESFDRTLEVDPRRASALHARRSAYQTAPSLEVNAQYGSTSGIDSGLRAVEVAHWPALSTRFAVRYDDSLSLDNRTLAQRGEDAPGYYFNVQQAIGPRWLGRVEVGRRQLVDGDQDLAGLQAVASTRMGTLKLGAEIGRHEAGYDDQTMHAGFEFGVAERWRLEPVVFLSEFGPEADREWRTLLNVTYRPGLRWEGGARVPWIIAGPGIAAGSVSRTPVVGWDVLPTVADALGLADKILPLQGIFDEMVNEAEAEIQRLARRFSDQCE